MAGSPDDLPANGVDTFAGAWTREELDSPGAAGRTLANELLSEPSRPEPLPPIAVGPIGDVAAFTELEVLGRGGMGVIHAARDEVLDRVVAVKRPRADAGLAVDRSLIAEARTLARLEHPNILPVHALGQGADGRPVLVMKRVSGERWSDLARRGPDLDRDIRIALAVADALGFAHQVGTLHRDVKPDNVMVGAFGEVWLMDWGCACPLPGATTTAITGTPSYMAPEMTEVGRAIGPWTDVFLLAASLQRVLTGAPRHQAPTLKEVLLRAWRCEPGPWPVGFPHELAAILDRACARDPAARPQDATRFAAELRDYLRHRDALDLVDEAATRLPLLRDATGPDLHALHAELRLELRVVLRGWPECTQAKELLAELARAAIASHRLAGEFAAAEALLTDLAPDERGPLAATIERDRAEAEARERAARENDARVAARERWQLAIVVLVGAVALMLLVTLSTRSTPLGATQLAGLGVVSLALQIVAALPFRRRVFATRHSRGLVGAVFAGSLTSAVQRLIAVGAGFPVATTLFADTLIYATASILAGIALDGAAAWVAAPWVIGAVTIATNPASATFVFPWVAFASLVVILAVFTRALRRA